MFFILMIMHFESCVRDPLKRRMTEGTLQIPNDRNILDELVARESVKTKNR